MVIMSDAEAVGWKLSAIIAVIALAVVLFKPSKGNDIPLESKIVHDTVVVNDTINITDTVTIYKASKPDTVYINNID